MYKKWSILINLDFIWDIFCNFKDCVYLLTWLVPVYFLKIIQVGTAILSWELSLSSNDMETVGIFSAIQHGNNVVAVQVCFKPPAEKYIVPNL